MNQILSKSLLSQSLLNIHTQYPLSPPSSTANLIVGDYDEKNPDKEDFIGILYDEVRPTEIIAFTSHRIEIFTALSHPNRWGIYYKQIAKLEIQDSKQLIISDYDNRSHSIISSIWSLQSIKQFLDLATGNPNLSINKHLSDSETPGIIFGNISNASTTYSENKFIANNKGHGFAAERANNLVDLYKGHKAVLVGDDNAKNGADRRVDGLNIQSKYCRTASASIRECFADNQFRYLNPDGSPMQIEVPADQYQSAIQAMEDRISKGQVPGVKDTKEAKNIVRKGHFTYDQVKNIAKAGTIESIQYDAMNGAIIASTTFGITTVISFATSIWNGDSPDLALKNAAFSGLKVGGTTFITAVLAGQLSKAGFNSLLVGSSEALIQVLGPKGSAILVNAFRSGQNIYGAAAMKSAAKMLRGNVITGAVSVVVLSSLDIADIFRSRISASQLFKNLTNTASSVAGGTGGWIGGAWAGAAIGSFIPGIGSAVGGTIGGLMGAFGGGTLASKASSSITSKFIEDDAEKMVQLIEEEFKSLATDYLLTKKEVKNLAEGLSKELTGSKLKDMFASQNRKLFAHNLLEALVENEVQKREKIINLDEEKMQRGLRLLLEDMAEKNEEFAIEMA